MGDDAAVPGQGLETSSRAKLVRSPIPSYPYSLSMHPFSLPPLFRSLSLPPCLPPPSVSIIYTHLTLSHLIAQGVEGWVPYIGPVEQIVNR
jgi:hypothetical protein